jgi:hypothetical protein
VIETWRKARSVQPGLSEVRATLAVGAHRVKAKSMNRTITSGIAKQLHTLLPKPCFDRPFVCDGLPEKCVVMVIGENPAMRLEMNWWTFWDDASGFDFQKFESIFEAKRKTEGKRPISNTRARLIRLRNAGLRCLETNAFRNEGLGGNSGGVSNADLLQTFLKELPRLKAVIAHGSVAKAFLCNQPLPPHVRYFPMQHFRHERFENIDAVAREILES